MEKPVRKFRGAIIGVGHYGPNHLHGWSAVPGAEIVAICDRDRTRAEAAARTFAIGRVHADVDELLSRGDLDFVDVVTGPESHRALVETAARHRVHVICQKPMAIELEDAQAMVAACRAAGVQFMVHENFRWQPAFRAVKEAIAHLGGLFYGRIHLRSSYDVTVEQPYLAEYPRYITLDIGVHLLDLARFLMGEAETVYCRTHRISPRLKGDDVSTIVLGMSSGATCLVEMSYASKLDEDCFPQTLVELEGPLGSVKLGPHFQVTQVSRRSVVRRVVAPQWQSWSTPLFEAAQDSIVSVQRHWIECLREGREPETSGQDNLKTLELVFGAYRSAEGGELVRTGLRSEEARNLRNPA